MERIPSVAVVRQGLWLLTAAVAVSQMGCIIVPLMYRGRMAPAACNGLEGKRVAVICTADSSDFGPSPNAELVARNVSRLLAQNVKDVRVVDYQRVAAWMDEHDSAYIDYAEVGRGLKADMVVAIEIESLRLQDNATLYKGRAEYRLDVIDVADGGRSVFAPYKPPVIHPPHGGVPATSVTDEQFRRQFAGVVADEIARHFYEHDLNDQIAIETSDWEQMK